MTIVLFALNGLLMVVTPLIVATFLARRYGAEWGLFGAGAATFVGAQLFHLPFNAFVEARYLPEVEPGATGLLVAVALFYGLSAGLFEEVARYITFRFWQKGAREWSEGLMVGAGHGGIEALILGFLFIVNMAVLIGIERGYFRSFVPDGSIPEIEAQVTALFALPWYETLLGGVERILTIGVHLSLSLMVLRAVRGKSVLWLLLAIGWHALLNAAALVTAALASAVTAEMVIALFAIVSLYLIYRWREAPEEAVVEAPRESEVTSLVDKRPVGVLEELDIAEKLDESRYL